MKRTSVDLFSGIGGFALACKWANVQTVAFAETDDYATQILATRFPGVKNYGDVRNVPFISNPWLVCGGPPCQPTSVAGKRLGTADDRWLWPEALAVVERLKPEWVLFENPDAILTLNEGLEFERICITLESQGYAVQPIIIPACAVGAPHRRNRLWLIAHSDTYRAPVVRTRNGDTHGQRDNQTEKSRRNHEQYGANCNFEKIPADAHSQGLARSQPDSDIEPIRSAKKKWRAITEALGNSSLWANAGLNDSYSKPLLLGGVDGIPDKLDKRIGRIGNAVVPQVVYQIIKRMIEAEA